MIDRIQISTGAAVGTDGHATATAYSSGVHGEVLAVYVDYQGGPPAGTTDFTLSDESDPASENIINLPNVATNTKIYPRRNVQTQDGTDLEYADGYAQTTPYVVSGRLEATIDGANADDYCIVTVWMRR